MATTRYANAAGSNTAPYDTVAKGATDPATVFALTAAGDTVGLYGSFSPAAAYVIAASGSVASGLYNVTGVNSSGVEDGTKAVIDCGGTVASGITWAAKFFFSIRNIEIKNATGAAIQNTTNAAWGDCEFRNLYLHACNYGINDLNNNGLRVRLTNCFILSVTTAAIFGMYSNWTLRGCVIKSCVIGINPYNGAASGLVVENCLFISNSNYCATVGSSASAPNVFRNCVFDRNGTGIIVIATTLSLYIWNCDFTNNTTGLSLASGKVAFEDWCTYYGNTTARSVNAAALLVRGGNSVDAGSDPHTSSSTGDFSRVAGSSLSRHAQTMADGSNTLYQESGIPSSDNSPALAKVMADTSWYKNEASQTGTLALANVLTAAGGTFDEAARNTITDAHVELGYNYTRLGSASIGSKVSTVIVVED